MFSQGLNITIVSYLFYAADFMPTRPYCGPALELGVQRLRDVYGFNATLRYVGDPAIKSVPDIVANVYRVADFYNNKWDGNGVFAMIVPGTEEIFPLGQLSAGWNSILIPSGGYFNILRNRALYPTTFGTALMQYSVLVEVFTAVLNHYGWKSICIIKDVSTIVPFTISGLRARRLPALSTGPVCR
ncbi:hypothetical protein RvY_19055-1 [Ramazzottius varieornatus]|uniref:Receptor ligand binding region domain-containing protein n=1 Tax=Ramazzottius varieornatus TaxID=947166 RepID=A0A1D1WAH2_RAMVA|nr:hypothetical protein RvY_19055-1 [Ramazzottius varieornatus]